jgi:hypothetical protein
MRSRVTPVRRWPARAPLHRFNHIGRKNDRPCRLQLQHRAMPLPSCSLHQPAIRGERQVAQRPLRWRDPHLRQRLIIRLRAMLLSSVKSMECHELLGDPLRPPLAGCSRQPAACESCTAKPTHQRLTATHETPDQTRPIVLDHEENRTLVERKMRLREPPGPFLRRIGIGRVGTADEAILVGDFWISVQIVPKSGKNDFRRKRQRRSHGPRR